MRMLQDSTIVTCQLWVGWTRLYTTEQKSSAVHFLRPLRCKFYGRAHTKKKVTAGHSCIAPENVLWVEEKKTSAQARLISKVYVTSCSNRRFTVASKGMVYLTSPSLEPTPDVTVVYSILNNQEWSLKSYFCYASNEMSLCSDCIDTLFYFNALLTLKYLKQDVYLILF